MQSTAAPHIEYALKYEMYILHCTHSFSARYIVIQIKFINSKHSYGTNNFNLLQNQTENSTNKQTAMQLIKNIASSSLNSNLKKNKFTSIVVATAVTAELFFCSFYQLF